MMVYIVIIIFILIINFITIINYTLKKNSIDMTKSYCLVN